ncbi:phBC6A51 family helix-turn-helix protein [Rummeliibacillus sp. JY-2-4R]
MTNIEVITEPSAMTAPTIDAKKYDLTPAQLEAAQAVLSNEMTIKRKGNRRKTYQELADELGISHDTLARWRALPEFQRYTKDSAQAFVNSGLAMAVTRLYELADGSITGSPSIKAIEMILSMGGLYSKTQTHEITVATQSQGMAQVSDEELAEIVAEYVED